MRGVQFVIRDPSKLLSKLLSKPPSKEPSRPQMIPSRQILPSETDKKKYEIPKSWSPCRHRGDAIPVNTGS